LLLGFNSLALRGKKLLNSDEFISDICIEKRAEVFWLAENKVYPCLMQAFSLSPFYRKLSLGDGRNCPFWA